MKDKPVWFEGMLLRPQHFQQQERYLFDCFQASLESVTRYRWGLRHIEYDEGKLGHRELAITKCEGILPDGTPFALTDPGELPDSIHVAPGSRNVRIFLGLPNNERIGGANLIDEPTATPDQTHHPAVEPRFRSVATQLTDVNLGFPEKQTVHLARSCFKLFAVAAGNQDESGGRNYIPPPKYISLPVAHIKEVVGERIVIDHDFITPCIELSDVPILKNRIIPGMRNDLELCASAHTDWLQRTNGRGPKEIDALLTLIAINRHRLIQNNLGDGSLGHPFYCYRSLLELFSDLSTTRTASRIPSDPPPYRHDDLKSCLLILIERIQTLLRIPLEPDVVKIPVERIKREERYFLARASAQLRSLVKVSAPFYLVANVSADDQRDFMNQCIIAEAHSLEELLAAGKRGITLEPITRWPNGIPSDKDSTCFRLAQAPYSEIDIDKRAENEAHWDAIAGSEVGIGFHVRIDLPGLTLSLWAERRSKGTS